LQCLDLDAFALLQIDQQRRPRRRRDVRHVFLQRVEPVGRDRDAFSFRDRGHFAAGGDQFRLDVGRYPTTEQGLAALLTRPGDEPKWNGPYLQNAVPLDPWGKAYIYRAPGEKGDYDIVSYGKDGAPGGTGASADISLF